MLLFKKREKKNILLNYAVILASVFLSLVIAGMLFVLNKVNPLLVIWTFFRTPFFSHFGIMESLLITISIALCALSVSVAAKINLWNIGAEGQLIFGAIGASLIGIYFANLPPFIVVFMMVSFGMVLGAIYAAIPGILKAWLGASEILVTLMLNYIALSFLSLLLFGPLRGPGGFPYSVKMPAYSYIPTIFNSRLHLGIVAVLLIVGAFYLFLKKTSYGYKIRVIGESQKVATYSGIAVKRNLILVMILSGALAGLSGVFDVMGSQHQLSQAVARGYGFTGIIVSWLAKNNLLLILPIGFFISGLFVGGEEIQMLYRIPSSIVSIVQGTILLFVLAGNIFTEYKLVWEK